MAQGVRFVCGKCDDTIEAWDDGNPYYLETVMTKIDMEKGQFGEVKQKKKYAYHQSHEFDLCIGNDSPHLCLSCGKEFMVDSETPITACPKCKSSEIVDTMKLDGKSCLYCTEGVFGRDPEFYVIS